MSLVACAPAAFAETDCDAPPGTAAVDQYCETLPTVDGTADVSQTPRRPLAIVLPNSAVQEVLKSGVVGEVLLALPVADEHRSGDVAQQIRRARFDPQVKALLPGPAVTARSVVGATAGEVHRVGQGFGWVLVLLLFGLGGLSLWGSLRIP